MGQSGFDFCIVRYMTDPIRGEFVNIGIVVRDLDQETSIPIMRITEDWSRVICLDPTADVDELSKIKEELERLFTGRETDSRAMYEELLNYSSGGLQFSRPSVSLRSGNSDASAADKLATLYKMFVATREPPIEDLEIERRSSIP